MKASELLGDHKGVSADKKNLPMAFNDGDEKTPFFIVYQV